MLGSRLAAGHAQTLVLRTPPAPPASPPHGVADCLSLRAESASPWCCCLRVGHHRRLHAIAHLPPLLRVHIGQQAPGVGAARAGRACQAASAERDGRCAPFAPAGCWAASPSSPLVLREHGARLLTCAGDAVGSSMWEAFLCTPSHPGCLARAEQRQKRKARTTPACVPALDLSVTSSHSPPPLLPHSFFPSPRPAGSPRCCNQRVDLQLLQQQETAAWAARTQDGHS